MFDTLFHFLQAGGFFMLPLGICSIASLTLILERSFALRRKKIFNPELVEALTQLRHGEKTTRIEQLCADQTTTLCRLIRTCLVNLPWSKFENTETLQTKARVEISQMDRGLVILEIVVGTGPLLGLLGTVSGLVTIFSNVGDAGLASQGVMIARGISEALNTTITGLAVAVPSLIAHSIFTRRIDTYAIELESLCVDFLGKLYTQAETLES